VKVGSGAKMSLDHHPPAGVAVTINTTGVVTGWIALIKNTIIPTAAAAASRKNKPLISKARRFNEDCSLV